MRSLRVVWFIAIILMLSPLAAGQGFVAVKRYQPKETPGEAGNPGKYAHPRGRGFGTPNRNAGNIPGTLERPAEQQRVGTGERDPRTAPRPPPDEQGTVWLARHEVKLSVVDGIAVTKIDQTFKSDWSVQMEGVYVCPLPENAVINGFSIFMAGREVRGSVMEREEARRIYDRIVGRRRDPGLVELVDDGTAIRTSIFPIPPKGEMRIRTEYAWLLDGGAGGFAASIPFPVTKSKEARPIEEVKVDVQFRSSWPMRLTAPEEFRTRERDGGRFWSCALTERDYRAEGNLDLLCHPGREAPGLKVNVHLGPDGRRTFVAIIGAGKRKLTGARLKFKGANVRSMFPEKIPVIAPGGQALVFGSLEGTKRPVVTLDASEGYSRVLIRTPVERISTTAESTRHIPCFRALGQVHELLEAGNLEDEDRLQVISLSKRYGILTRLTAFLAK